jgi:hypothetical protein
MSLNRKIYDASARWGVRHPRKAARLAAVLWLGMGVAATWWTVANLDPSNVDVSLFSAAAGAILGTAGALYWAYVGLAKRYAVGTVGKVAVRIYIYGLILAVLVFFFTFDHPAGISFVAAGTIAATFLVAAPLMLIANRRYLEDPSAGPELAEKAHSLTGFGGPPPD